MLSFTICYRFDFLVFPLGNCLTYCELGGGWFPCGCGFLAYLAYNVFFFSGVWYIFVYAKGLFGRIAYFGVRQKINFMN